MTTFFEKILTTCKPEPKFNVGDEAVLKDQFREEPDCDVEIVKCEAIGKGGNFRYRVKSKATGKILSNGEWFEQKWLRQPG